MSSWQMSKFMKKQSKKSNIKKESDQTMEFSLLQLALAERAENLRIDLYAVNCEIEGIEKKIAELKKHG